MGSSPSRRPTPQLQSSAGCRPAPPTLLFSPSPPTVLEEELTQRSPAVATETTIPGRASPAPAAWRTSSLTALTPARASSPRSSLWRRNSGRGSRGIVRHHMAVRHRQQHVLAQSLGPQELLTEKEAPISSCRAGSTSSGSFSSPTLPPRLPPPRRISLPRSRASPSGGTTQPCRLPRRGRSPRTPRTRGAT
jgi:hypothetical protein